MTKIQSQSNSIPLYLQVKNKIKQEIRSGILKAGDKLDSEAEMQKEYGMSRVTVRNAMAELEGVMNEDLTGSLYEILQEKYHMTPSIKGRRSVKIIFATEEIAKLLKLSVGTPVIESEVCVFDINGGPVHTVKDIVRGDNDNILKWYV